MLAAWGFPTSGAKVLLYLMAGSKEDAETVSAFLQDIRGPRPRRTPAGGPGRCGGHHHGDRDFLLAIGASTLPHPSHAQPGGQGNQRKQDPT